MFVPSVQHLDSVRRLCAEHGVRRLGMFGSGARDDFDPGRSDLDFLVDFGGTDLGPWSRRFFDLQDALRDVFQRPVDLVMVGALRGKPSWDHILREQVPLYAAA